MCGFGWRVSETACSIAREIVFKNWNCHGFYAGYLEH